jgi:AcrR family transcriptional regulator
LSHSSAEEGIQSSVYRPFEEVALLKLMMTVMPVKKVNKQELRTRETRELLLQAAEKIFVRDGYEGAELGEIAALAGRTKGAIYAQFASKEDVFFALVEDRSLRYRAQMKTLLAESASVEGNMAAYRKFALQLADDHAWCLLLLEFKLFALRHPESIKRLQGFHAGMLSPNDEKRVAGLLGPAGKAKGGLSRVVAVTALHSIFCALVLESKFEPDILDEDARKKVEGVVFDALLES